MLRDVIAPRLQKFVNLTNIHDSFSFDVKSKEQWEYVRLKEAAEYCFALFNINFKRGKYNETK